MLKYDDWVFQIFMKIYFTRRTDFKHNPDIHNTLDYKHGTCIFQSNGRPTTKFPILGHLKCLVFSVNFLIL